MTDDDIERELRVRRAQDRVRRTGAWKAFAEAVVDRGLPLDASVMTGEQAEAFVELADAWNEAVRRG
jgi:hypothetical protein